MLKNFDIDAYLLGQNSLPDKGYDFITKTADSPSRMVGVRARQNVISFPFSEKAGLTLSAESRGPEAGFLRLCEYQEDVILALDQVEPITIMATNKNGKIRPKSYTADALVFRDDFPEVVEVKGTDYIDKLVCEQPSNWKRCDNGTVDFIPARLAFEEMGIRFRVFEYTTDMARLILNVSILLMSREDCRELNISKTDLDSAFAQSCCWTLAELKDFLEIDEITPLVRAIDEGELSIDMIRSLISEPKGCVVARTPMFLELGYESLKQGSLLADDLLTSLDLSAFPSEIEAERVLKKLEILDSGVKNRSTRRWLKQIKDGREKGLTEFQSLVSDYENCGNRTRRPFIDVENFLQNYVHNEHPAKRGISIYRSYVNYRVDAKEAHPHYDPVSRPTFIDRLLKVPPEIIAIIRGGNRAANAAAAPSDPNKRSIKAQFSWQTATIDHYLADIELIFFANQNEVFVVRPWITAMVDIHSNEVLAVTLSFKPPSRIACAKVMRECVRRHGKLPREIIVDRGSDFKSVYFAALLAHFKITLSIRPSGNPRYGSEVERLFGEFRELWLSQLPGNRADKREVRSADGKTDPKKFAIFQPYEFYRSMLSFCEWRSARCRGNATESTGLRFRSSERLMPFVPVNVEYDTSFLLATAVDVDRYKIDFQRGLHINNAWYWSPELLSLRGKLGRVNVRVDPENPHLVFAQLFDKWVVCGNSETNTFSTKDPITQKVEGLLMREGQAARDAIRLLADEQLVHKIREMTRMAEDASTIPVLEVDSSAKSNSNSLFDRIRETEVSALELESWEDA